MNEIKAAGLEVWSTTDIFVLPLALFNASKAAFVEGSADGKHIALNNFTLTVLANVLDEVHTLLQASLVCRTPQSPPLAECTATIIGVDAVSSTRRDCSPGGRELRWPCWPHTMAGTRGRRFCCGSTRTTSAVHHGHLCAARNCLCQAQQAGRVSNVGYFRVTFRAALHCRLFSPHTSCCLQ